MTTCVCFILYTWCTARRDQQMVASEASPCGPNKPVLHRGSSATGNAEKSLALRTPAGEARNVLGALADDQLIAIVPVVGRRAALLTREVLRAPRRPHRGIPGSTRSRTRVCYIYHNSVVRAHPWLSCFAFSVLRVSIPSRVADPHIAPGVRARFSSFSCSYADVLIDQYTPRRRNRARRRAAGDRGDGGNCST